MYPLRRKRLISGGAKKYILIHSNLRSLVEKHGFGNVCQGLCLSRFVLAGAPCALWRASRTRNVWCVSTHPTHRSAAWDRRVQFAPPRGHFRILMASRAQQHFAAHLASASAKSMCPYLDKAPCVAWRCAQTGCSATQRPCFILATNAQGCQHSVSS